VGKLNHIPENFVLCILIILIVGPILYITVYPHLNSTKVQRKDELLRHKEQVNYINLAIQKAQNQQHGTRVYGAGRNRQEQSEIDEIYWKGLLVEENVKHKTILRKIDSIPLSTGESVGLLALYITLIGLYVNLRGKKSKTTD